MARIIALANQKGGVGKTTSTLALGAALADRGRRVLLVDLDPQASLTSAAGVELRDDDTTLYTALTTYVSTGETDAALLGDIMQGITLSLNLLPAGIDLAAAEMELLGAVRREYVLTEILAPLRDADDVVLIDCTPSLSLLTLNALTVADAVLIPVVPDYLAARGLGLLLDTIERVRKSKLNPRLSVAGVILTMVDYRTAHNREVAASVRAHLGDRILGDVKRSTKTAEAAAAGLSVTAYAPRGEAALAYGEIADALLARWGVAARNVSNNLTEAAYDAQGGDRG